MSEILSTALELLASGRSVVPVAPGGKKAPSFLSNGTVQNIKWKDYQSRLPTEKELRTWFADPAMGIGIVCGEISGDTGHDGLIYGLETFDFDDKVILGEFRETLNWHGHSEIFEKCVFENSPAGAHLGYLTSDIIGNQKLATRPATEAELAENPGEKIKGLIETRGEGGYIIIAPTPPGINPKYADLGYEMVWGAWTHPPALTSEERDILLSFARSFNKSTDVDFIAPPAPANTKRIDGIELPGDWYNNNVSREEMLDLMCEVGWTWTRTRQHDGVDELTRPGKGAKDGISATLGACGKPNSLYVFTSSTEFEPEKTYAPFAVYANLKHGGNYSAAAYAIAQRPDCPVELTPSDNQGGGNSNNYREASDAQNATIFTEKHGHEVRYCQDAKDWYLFDGTIWAPKSEPVVRNLYEENIAERLAAVRSEITDIEEEIITTTDQEDIDKAKALAGKLKSKQAQAKFLQASQNERKIDDGLRSARRRHPISVTRETFDNHIDLLTVENGVVRLSDGKSLPFDPDLHLTQKLNLPYDPGARRDRFDKFLMEIMGGAIGPPSPEMSEATLDERDRMNEKARELVEFLQRSVGYWLTGNTGKEEYLWVFCGDGANGKSTIQKLLGALFTDVFFTPVTKDLIIRPHFTPHPTERADFYKRRLAYCSELPQGKPLASENIKELVAGTTIRARRMGQDFWNFKPTHSMVIETNHKPVIDDHTNGIWRKILLVPFNVKFISDDQLTPEERDDPTTPVIDNGLVDILLEELPGILAWAIEGSVKWHKDGLKIPKVVLEATADYKEEQDGVIAFIRDRCVVVDQARVQTKALYDAYCEWHEENGDGPELNRQDFGSRLSPKGFKRKQSHGKYYYYGIDLNPDEEQKEDTRYK